MKLPSLAPWLALPIVGVVGFQLGLPSREPIHSAPNAHAGSWTCSMHPNITRAEPGACPVCSMPLVPAASQETDTLAEVIKLSRAAHMRTAVRTAAARRLGVESKPLVKLFGRATDDKLTLELDAYEAQLPRLRVGQKVYATSRALHGERLSGTVTAIGKLNPETKTTRINARIQDQQHRLEPGQHVSALVATSTDQPGQQPLIVPASAVLFLGTRALVYVELQNASMRTYEARVITLGEKKGDDYVVLSGLSDADSVVVNAAFILDADAQLRGRVSMMRLADDQPIGTTVDEPPDPRTIERDAKNIRAVLAAYLLVQHALVGDDATAADQATHALLKASTAFRPPPTSSWYTLAGRVDGHAREMLDADGLAAKRVVFVDLSVDLIELVRAFGNRFDETVWLVHCPMARNGQGADWLQLGQAVQNPYFGSQMPSCGSLVEQAAPAMFLSSVKKSDIALGR